MTHLVFSVVSLLTFALNVWPSAAIDCPTTTGFSGGFDGYSQIFSSDKETEPAIWYSSRFVPLSNLVHPGPGFVSNSGDFLYISYIFPPATSKKATLASPIMQPNMQTDRKCQMKFSLYSYYDKQNSKESNSVPQQPLVVFLHQNSSSHLLFKTSNFSARWETFKVEIASSQTYQVQFVANVEAGQQGFFTAIDNITFSQECCRSAENSARSLYTPTHFHRACSTERFQTSLGDFTEDRNSHKWSVGADYLYDQDGHFAYVQPFQSQHAVRTSKTTSFSLASPFYNSAPSTCQVSFKYNLYTFVSRFSQSQPSPSDLMLGLSLNVEGQVSNLFTAKYQSDKNGIWQKATVRVTANGKPFQISFTAEVKMYFSVVGLDDVEFSAGCCAQSSAQLRLVGGSTNNTGLLQVKHDGVWGSVCDDNWDLADATVACRQLGFYSAAVPEQKNDVLREHGEEVWMDDVECDGTEKSLEECQFVGWAGTDCTHKEDVSVTCVTKRYKGSYAGAVRLYRGSYAGAGNLQVYLNEKWQPVCQNAKFTYSAASVVCRQLGYNSTETISLSAAPMSESLMTGLEFQCTGHEPQLMACSSQSAQCGQHGVVQIACVPPPERNSGPFPIASIVGIVAAVLVLALLLLFAWRWSKRSRSRSNSLSQHHVALTSIDRRKTKDGDDDDDDELLDISTGDLETRLRSTSTGSVQPDRYTVNGYGRTRHFEVKRNESDEDYLEEDAPLIGD